MKVAVEPAIRQQAAFREAYREKQDEYKREMRQYEVERKDASRNGLAAPPPPEEPVMERTVVEDTTTEALAVVLEGTPRGVSVMRDDLSAWIRSMDQYKAGGKGADRQSYLAAWSGSYASVDRKGRKPSSGNRKRGNMGLKGKLDKLEKAMRGSMESFELRDGTRYYFDPQEAGKITFLYFAHSLSADWKREPRPEPPEVLQAVSAARDRGEALFRVMGTATHLPVDREALLERGEFVPRSLVAGFTYEEWMAEGREAP